MKTHSRSSLSSLGSGSGINNTLNSAFQMCMDTSDAVELFVPQQLYLKPVARLNVSVQLPQLKLPGKTISNWEVMEKLKVMVKPVEFTVLKVSKSTLEFIRFEGEIENKSNLNGVISRLDGRTIKLSGFSELLKIRAAEAKMSLPTRHTWDSYFRDAKNMNEMKPGERPDTIHLANLPCKWFSSKRDSLHGSDRPSEYIFRKVFEQFGEVRCVDIPVLDPYRSQMKAHISGMKTFSFGQELAFEGYVQFQEYVCFVKAMDALRGMKLLYKEGEKAYTASIKVDFDRTKHLSDASLRRRRVERDKLMARERELEESERREKETAEKEAADLRKLKEEEEREKAKLLEERKQRKAQRHQARQLRRLKREEAQRINYNIAVEERKLLIAQRKLESIRLLDELFERVKVARLQEISKKREGQAEEKVRNQEKGSQENLEDKERQLRSKLMQKFKTMQEQQLKGQQEKLRKTIEGKNKIYSVLAVCGDQEGGSSGTEDSTSSASAKESDAGTGTCHKKLGSGTLSGEEKTCARGERTSPAPDTWFAGVAPMALYAHIMGSHGPSPMAFELPPHFQNRYPFARGATAERWKRWQGPGPRPGRGRRGRGQRDYNCMINSNCYYDSMGEYYEYFRKLAGQGPSRSRSRSRSSSGRAGARNTRNRSRSCSRSRRHSRSRSRSRSRGSRPRKGRSASKERSRSRRESSRENSRSRTRSGRITKESWSRSRSRKRSRTVSRSSSHGRERERSHMRSLSKDLSSSPSPLPTSKKENGSEENSEKIKETVELEKDDKDSVKRKKKRKHKHKKSKQKDTTSVKGS